MDLFCPHCSKKVAIPDDKAGQVMSCPLCAKQFMAPSLAPQPVAPPTPSPPPPPATATEPTVKPAASPEPPTPPPPPGDYSRSLALCLRAEWLVFVPPACFLLIFILSFFTWHLPIPNEDSDKSVPALSLWTLAWSKDGQAQFLAYLIFMFFPCGLLTFAALPFDKGWIPAPPPVAPFMMWKNLLIGLVVGLPFLLLCYDYLSAHLLQQTNPVGVAMKIGIRLHFLAIMSSFGIFWLHLRKKNNLPAPKLELHW